MTMTSEGQGKLRPDVGRAFYGRFDGLRSAQGDAIDPITKGFDTIILAGTGSGKTEAMMAPLVSRYYEALRAGALPVILYVAPTRALVNDVRRRLGPVLEMLNVAFGVRHAERNDLARVGKPQVVVTTPESLDVLISKHAALLTDVSAVVLDEAHQYYNTQRGLQVAILLRRLTLTIKHSVQVVAASATVADGAALWGFFRPEMTPRVVADPTSREICVSFFPSCTREELGEVLELLREAGSARKVLVFCDSRRECNEVALLLRESLPASRHVFSHHSAMSKDEREHAEREMDQQQTAICVCTSTLELGIDIGDIDLVVLFGRATGWESFLQRVGRGNRRANFVDVIAAVPDSRSKELTSVLSFPAVEFQVRTGGFEATGPLLLRGAVVQQILTICQRHEGSWYPRVQLWELLGPWLKDKAELDDILSALVASEYLVAHPVKAAYGPGEQSHRLEELNLLWGNFPSASSTVPIVEGQSHVGDIPRDAAFRLDEGDVVAFAGKRVQITRIDGREIRVRASASAITTHIRFGGTAAEFDPSLLEAMWLLLASDPTADVARKDDREALRLALAPLQEAVRCGRLPVIDREGHFAYLTFAGRSFNRLLADWFGIGGTEQGELQLLSPVRLDFSTLPSSMEEFGDRLRSVVNSEGSETTFQKLLPPDVRVAESVSLWLRTPSYPRTIQRLRASTQQVLVLPDGCPTPG